ncbi:MAG: hypothetical protein WKF75_09270 [Singulisphaera sp.]
MLPLGHLDNAPSFDGGTGIYGASYTAAAGMHKNLGYLPAGYDGADNNRNGLVDEYSEGVNGTNSALVLQRLAAHQHETARSEMLYAVLVEGQGPLGRRLQRRRLHRPRGPRHRRRRPPRVHRRLGRAAPVLPLADLLSLRSARRATSPAPPAVPTTAPSNPGSRARSTRISSSSPPPGGRTARTPGRTRQISPRPPRSAAESWRSRPTSIPWSSRSPAPARRRRNRSGAGGRWPRHSPNAGHILEVLIASAGPDQELGIARSLAAPHDDYGRRPAHRESGRAGDPRPLAGHLQGSEGRRVQPGKTAGLLEAGLDDVTNHSIMSAGGGVQ